MQSTLTPRITDAARRPSSDQATADQPDGRGPWVDRPLKAALQDDIALRHLDIAESVARSFAATGPEASDIRQVAYLGLIKAVQRFDPARGVPFASFAVPTITGEIKRYLRDSCWVVRPPRDVQDLRTEIARTAPAMAQRLGREATARELGVELGWPEAKILEAQACQSSLRPDSLDAPFEGRSWADTLATDAAGTDRSDDMISLRGAVNALDGGEKELLYRRYFMEQTQQAMADELGMSQMQVSRALARILVKLQKRLLEAPSMEEVRGAGTSIA
ncbi:sigma-70 family RNA polymerase sigma factor [Arthrobacter agilis]|uniref:sigma-70 family RNA polymerase sigma factor n=1 Tax=Arthrobacter agilis TaxID=37921 RepID=UPI0023668E3D|nr:sigma-70 family RNA polymerase sigma factor [Arthrobacter agilis]WDF32206.1 sigma-70 family RNA polymerase sigma factor [Arthrobacter agilis]